MRVLGFAGSLRERSLNRALLRAALEAAPEGMSISIFELNDIPVYNGDVEARGDPKAVADFKSAIRDADALLIATPEYNHGVPGVLKNAIDWASRPPASSALSGKPTAIIGASPGMTGSARAQTQLRQAFNFTNTPAMLQPEILVARAHEKFDAEGRLTDDVTRRFLGKFLVSFVTWVALFGDRPS
ncbi:MAG: NAD(P)H-dependent oxidoreductase [Anaerolineae bacterium]|nr:NAD(P)H-dependent oxidoreductase [Gemmatimonadaceae bacterium]